MGIVYLGPYHDEVHTPVWHEGYAARLMPDGALVGSWGGNYGHDGHIGLVGACTCGWRAPDDAVHPADSYDSPAYQAAEADFEELHLQPLIEAAAARSWPDWATRSHTRVDIAVELVAQGRIGEARQMLQRLHTDLGQRIALADNLHQPEPARPANANADQLDYIGAGPSDTTPGQAFPPPVLPAVPSSWPSAGNPPPPPPPMPPQAPPGRGR